MAGIKKRVSKQTTRSVLREIIDSLKFDFDTDSLKGFAVNDTLDIEYPETNQIFRLQVTEVTGEERDYAGMTKEQRQG